MTDAKLPTTAGSIIKFEAWEGLDSGTKTTFLATLIPDCGSYDIETNTFSQCFWFVPDIEDIFTITGIKDAGFEVVFEAPEPNFQPGTEIVDEYLDSIGSIALVELDEPDKLEPLVLVPSYLEANGVIGQCHWTKFKSDIFGSEIWAHRHVSRHGAGIITTGRK